MKMSRSKLFESILRNPFDIVSLERLASYCKDTSLELGDDELANETKLNEDDNVDKENDYNTNHDNSTK